MFQNCCNCARCCQVGRNSTLQRTQCFTSHLTSFAGGWVVAPNPIDFSYVFANLDFLSNPTLYVTQIVIAVIYVIAVVWARRKDKKDVTKVRQIQHTALNVWAVHTTVPRPTDLHPTEENSKTRNRPCQTSGRVNSTAVHELENTMSLSCLENIPCKRTLFHRLAFVHWKTTTPRTVTCTR